MYLLLHRFIAQWCIGCQRDAELFAKQYYKYLHTSVPNRQKYALFLLFH